MLVVMVDMGSPVAASPRGGRAVSRARRLGTRVRLNFTNHVFCNGKVGGGGEATGRLQRDWGVNEAVLYLTLGL